MESVTQKSCNLFSAVMILHIWALEHFKVLCFQTWWTINKQHVRKSTLEDVLSLLKFPRPRCLLLAGLFFFWDNSRALQPKAFLAVGKLDKNHCNTEGLRISGNFFSPKWWRSMHLLALVTLGSMLCLRQQLLHVEIFEVQVPLQMELEDEWVGRLGATVLNR